MLGKIFSSSLPRRSITNQHISYNRPRRILSSWNSTPNTYDTQKRNVILASSFSLNGKEKLKDKSLNDGVDYRHYMTDHKKISSLDCLRRKRHNKILPRNCYKKLELKNKIYTNVKEKTSSLLPHNNSPMSSPPLVNTIFHDVYNGTVTSQTPSFSSSLASRLFLVSMSTAGSYISGGLFGYIIGSARNIPSIISRTKPLHKPNTFANFHELAFKQGKSCASISATFTAFQSITKILRKVDDKWNNIVGSFCTGIYLNRENSLQEMVKGGATYGGFTYLLSRFSKTTEIKMIEDCKRKDPDSV